MGDLLAIAKRDSFEGLDHPQSLFSRKKNPSRAAAGQRRRSGDRSGFFFAGRAQILQVGIFFRADAQGFTGQDFFSRGVAGGCGTGQDFSHYTKTNLKERALGHFYRSGFL